MGGSVFIGILRIPEMIRERDGGWDCVWWVTVFLIMIGTFYLVLNSDIHFSILILLIGVAALLIDLYILWGILMTTGIIHSSDVIRFPLIRLHAIYLILIITINLLA